MSRYYPLVRNIVFALSLASAVFAYSALSATSSSLSTPRAVVVVGGGPVGLATAITLARPPHSCQVTVLERQVGNGQAKYDPTRSYLYNVNPRGLLWFDRHNFTSSHHDTPLFQLTQRGSSPAQGMGTIMTIPADPTVPLAPPRQVTMGAGNNMTVPMKRSFWIPRHQMVEILQDECRKENVTLLHGKQVQSMSATTDSAVTVQCTDGTEYTSALVVAADGYESSVRDCLMQQKRNENNDWLSAPQWRVRRYQSPATGVKLKALQFQPNFTIPNGTESVATESEGIYVFRGTKNGPRSRLSLGFLPVKDPNLVRPGNTNTRYNHILWSLKDGPSMKKFFQENFPRLEWDNYISENEWERFAQANGTFCQYSTGAAVWSPEGAAGVVLVGDACHAFPPDIGQGINAGLQDVVALDQSLRGEDIDTMVVENKSTDRQSTNSTLAEALAAYQTNRVPEHKALVRLARFGSPYQYRQPWIRDRIGRFVWMLNVSLRMLLNKISSKFPPPAILLVNQRPDLTYRQVMKRADTLTLILKRLMVEAVVWRLGILKANWLLYGWIATGVFYLASRLFPNQGNETN